MNLQKLRKLSIIMMVITGWLFSGFATLPNFFHFKAEAAIKDIGHFRDSVGGQIAGTGFTPFNFDQSIQNDGIYTRPDNATIQLDEAGDYLIISTIRDLDTSVRYNSQARVVLSSGTGDLFTSHFTGFARDASENSAWKRTVGVLIGASAGAQVQIHHRRGTFAPTGGSVAGQSDIQVVRINPTNYGIYSLGDTTALGGTMPNTVDVTAVISESNTAAIEGNIVTDTITVKGDNKRYLTAWSVSLSTATDRSQRIGHLEYDAVDDLATRSYCYVRDADNEYCGLGSMDMMETITADRDIQVEVFRGPGVLADQGGADNDSGLNGDGDGQIIVLEMPESLETFRSHDTTGLQDLTAAATLNIARDVDFNDAASFTKATNTLVDITIPANIFSWANIWAARSNITSTARQTSFGSITLDGVEQSTGNHGNYSRGDQGTLDTFGLGYHPAGIFTTATAGVDLGVNSDPLAGGEAGGTDRTQPGTLGFFAFNIDTLAPSFEQSAYRFFENVDSSDVGTALAVQDTPATLASAGAAFRLRSLLNVSDVDLPVNGEDFKLQFAERVGVCDTSFSGETYVDVTAGTVIAFNDNATPIDGSSLTANANDPINGLNLIVNQSYKESNNFTNSSAAINTDQDGKWDFSLIDNGAAANTSYCLRMVKSNGELLSEYTVIPEIITANLVGATPGGVATNLSVWLRSDMGTLSSTDASPTGDWIDQSSAGNDYSVVNSPTLQLNEFNFNPAVEIIGNTGFNAPAGADLGNENTVIFVSRKLASDINGRLFEGSTGNYLWGYHDIDRNSIYINGNPSEFTNGIAIPTGTSDEHIFSYVHNGTTDLEVRADGDSLKTFTGVNSAAGILIDINQGAFGGAQRSDSHVGEFIIYDSVLTPTERQQVESYLGLKYGITLDQSNTGGGYAYTDSSGAIYWNEDTSDVYEHDIFGIGRDDQSEFDQRVSHSINTDAVITMALDSDFSSSNQDAGRITNHTSDRQFLTFANNNDSLLLQTTELDTGTYTQRIGREWQIQKTANFSQNVNLKFDGFNDDYVVLMDADGDFSSGAVNLGSLSSSGEITGLDLFNTQYITLANVSTNTTPGGVASNLSLWLRADKETYTTGTTNATEAQTIETWADQSVTDHDVSQSDLTARPLWRDNSLNFNPTVDFDGSNDSLTNPTAPFPSGLSDETNVFFVGYEEVRSQSSIFHFDDGVGSRFHSHYPWVDGRIYFDIGSTTAPDRISGLAPFSVGEASLGTFVNSISNNIQQVLVNALNVASDTTGESTPSNETIIGNFNSTLGYNGRIGEFIAYDVDLPVLQKRQVHSYLALKYGITLDQSNTGGGYAYTDSSGAIYWNEDTSDVYEHDIFGIGRDDQSEFDQRVSHSINTDAVITMALDSDFSSSNQDAARITTHTNNQQFLVLANNNVSTSDQTTEVPVGFTERIGREWQIQKTANFSQNVNLKFDGFTNEYSVYMDADGDFSAGAVNLGTLNADGEITGLDVSHMQYITLVKTIIPQELSFNIFDAGANNSIGHGLLSNANTRYATDDETGSTTAVTGHNITASTNATNGYTVELDGVTLTAMDGTGNTIDAIGGTATASTAGTEQFGIRLVPTGTGTASAPYDTANFALDTAAFTDNIATGTGDNTVTTYDVEYIANIDPLTPAGTYNATLTYTMHGIF